MKYAVVRIGGKQHKIVEGGTIAVDQKLGEPGKKVGLEEVLLLVDEGKVKMGERLKNDKVVGSVVSQQRAKKVTVQTYKAKTGQHRRAGHRQDQTKVKIEKIEG